MDRLFAPVSPRRPSLRRRLIDWRRGLERGLARLVAWRRIAAHRRHMAELGDHLLRDVGLTRAEVERESSRPFWDLPHWLDRR